MRTTSSVAQYIEFIKSVILNPEQVYPDVNLILFESLVRLEPKQPEVDSILEFSMPFLAQRALPGARECAAIVPLILLRYGKAKALDRLLSASSQKGDSIWLKRAAAIVYGGRGVSHLARLDRRSGTSFSGDLLSVTRLMHKLARATDVPDRMKARLSGLRRDSLTQQFYIDMRAVATARLIALSSSQRVKTWLRAWMGALLPKLTSFDAQMLSRLLNKVTR